MKKRKRVASVLVASMISLMTLFAVFKVEAIQDFFDFGYEPDMPGFLGKAMSKISKEEYLRMRDEQIALYRGMTDGDPVKNIEKRSEAIQLLEKQEELLQDSPDSPMNNALQAAWTPLGPNPIPNGQTIAPTTSVSGRTTAIAVHPTNPNIVYVGTAQGGVYRTLDGGTSWTPIMDNALSLAVGSIAIAPSQPETIYVGTGEGHCAKCYIGVGVYRIDNASTTAALSGPFNKNALSNDVLSGRGILKIIVHPTNPAIIFLGTSYGAAGIYGSNNPTAPAPERGLFRSFNATSANPTFEKLFISGLAAQDRGVSDVIMDPGNPNVLLAAVVDSVSTGEAGVFRSADALAVTPAFTKTFTNTQTGVDSRTEMAYHKDGNTGAFTVYLASGHNGGTVHKSTNGGASFTQTLDNDFCTAQCFYDIAIAVDPTNVNRVYLGGSVNLAFGISINGGTSFTASQAGLHVDSQVITVAPSSPNIVYFGSDGGIYKSIDSGASWTPIHNSQYYATQFISLDTHPADPNITIGGTQDNGTNRYKDDGTWTRTDYGDGGYAVIDQSSANTTFYYQYHTYYNSSTLTGYAFTTGNNAFENWTFRGCLNGTTANGISCTGTILFYAPLERGPSVSGSLGNTIYYGADRLYRSVDTGANHTTVSQTFTQPISAIGISPQNDNVRVVGLKDGRLFGTTTGSAALSDLDPSNTIPDNYVSRAIIDPTNSNTAYVTLSSYNIPQIYQTVNLNNATPTWTAISGAATGLPLVPVNAFAIENNVLYAGTDIGVYASNNGGTSWTPFGFGLPRVAVFDLAFAGTGINRVLRIATLGKGMYQIPAAVPQAILSVSGTVSYALVTSKKVGNTTVTANSTVGDPQVPSTTATGTGTYLLNNLYTYGRYNVVPTKSGQENGITSFDATLVLRHVAAGGTGPNALTANQQLAADGDGANGVTSFDATLILRYVAANGQTANTGNVGKWKFNPSSRSYNLTTFQYINQNFDGILIGEVNGDWTP